MFLVLQLGQYNDAISLVRMNWHEIAALNLILNGDDLQNCSHIIWLRCSIKGRYNMG